MRRLTWWAPCLCAFWLLISGCGGSTGHSRLQQPLRITSAVLPLANLTESYGGSTGFSVTAVGGTPPYRWTWVAAEGSTLPPGLSLSSNSDGTGTIVGTPTKTGPYSVIVTVTDSASPVVQKRETYIITVTATRPSSHAFHAHPEEWPNLAAMGLRAFLE
jgi:hypothetical protein